MESKFHLRSVYDGTVLDLDRHFDLLLARDQCAPRNQIAATLWCVAHFVDPQTRTQENFTHQILELRWVEVVEMNPRALPLLEVWAEAEIEESLLACLLRR